MKEKIIAGSEREVANQYWSNLKMCFVSFVSVLFYLLLCIVFINALPKIFCPFIFFGSPFLFSCSVPINGSYRRKDRCL